MGGDCENRLPTAAPEANFHRMNAQASSKLTMIYWKSDKFWLGRLREFPDIMTQGRTLKELEENMRDAWRMMVLADVPDDYALKEIAV